MDRDCVNLRVVAVIAVLAVGAYVYFVSSSQTEDPASYEAQLVREPMSTPMPVVSRPPSPTQISSTNKHETEKIYVSSSAQEEIGRCFPELIRHSYRKQRTLSGIAVDLRKQWQLNEVRQIWVNIHVGAHPERRLRLTWDHLISGKSTTRLSVFTIDEDGFPTPAELPVSHQWNPSAKVIRSYIGSERIVRTQEQVEYSGRQAWLQLRSENGEVVSMDFHTPERSLGCRPSHCRCY